MGLLNAMIDMICGRPPPVAEPASPRWRPDPSWTAFMFAHPSTHVSMQGKTAVWLMRSGWERPSYADLRLISPEMNAYDLYWKPAEAAPPDDAVIDAEWTEAAPAVILPRP